MRLPAVAFLLAGALFFNLAFAANDPSALDIAPGPLQQALQQLTELSGLQILYDPVLLQGRSTQGLKGTMTPRDALAKLLAQTDSPWNARRGQLERLSATRVCKVQRVGGI